jgi:hypothetical protein
MEIKEAIRRDYPLLGAPMHRYDMAGQVMRAGRVDNFKVTFNKTGKQIAESITGVLDLNRITIEELKADIAEVCKRRDIDPKEVIEAGSDEVAVEAYSMKASNNSPARTNTLVMELQRDLTDLRMHGMHIESITQSNKALERVQKHIEKERVFDLSYSELTEFGF